MLLYKWAYEQTRKTWATLHAIFPSAGCQTEIRYVETLRLEKTPEANVVFLSRIHRLTITKDEAKVKGNGTSPHSATNGRVWVEWVKTKSIRCIHHHPPGPGVLEVSPNEMRWEVKRFGPHPTRMTVASGEVNTRHRGLRQCVYPLADSNADYVTCRWVAPAHDSLAWAQMQTIPQYSDQPTTHCRRVYIPLP